MSFVQESGTINMNQNHSLEEKNIQNELHGETQSLINSPAGLNRSAVTEARRLENKALTCLNIAQLILPGLDSRGTEGEIIVENLAIILMGLSDPGVTDMLRIIRENGVERMKTCPGCGVMVGWEPKCKMCGYTHHSNKIKEESPRLLNRYELAKGTK